MCHVSKRSPIETILQAVDFSGGQLLIYFFLRFYIDYYLQKCGQLIDTVRDRHDFECAMCLLIAGPIPITSPTEPSIRSLSIST